MIPSTVIQPGKCRVCGCTETTPCIYLHNDEHLTPCGWMDAERTLCTNLHCVGATPLADLEAMAIPARVA